MTPRRWRLAIALVGAAVLIAIVPRHLQEGRRGNDFGAYYAAGTAVRTGESVWEARGAYERDYIYPPLLAVLVAPLTYFSEPDAFVLWEAFNLLCFGAVIWLLTRLVPPTRPNLRLAVGLVAVVAGIGPLDNDLLNGQVNSVVVLSIALAAYAWSRGRPGWSGFAVALGAAIKATPAIFLLFFLWKRSYAGGLGFTVGLLVGFLLVPAVGLGLDGAVEANEQWAQAVVRPYSEGREIFDLLEEEGVPWRPGYAIRTTLYRLFTPTRVALPEDAPSAHVGVLPEAVLEWIWRLMALALVAGAWLAWRRSRALPAGPAALRDFGLLAATMVLVAPVSLKAHFVAFLPALAWLAWDFSVTRSRWVLAALLLFPVLTWLPLWTLPPLTRDVVIARGAYALAGLGVWFAVACRDPGRWAPSAGRPA